MKDILLDLIQHTHALGFIDLIKITGTDTSTDINAIAGDRSVVIEAKLKTPSPELIGVMGFPNLSKLKTILGFDDYGDDSIIKVLRQDREGESVPTAIHFETVKGDFVNDYRLMSKALVTEKVKTVTFKGATWHVTFEPTLAGILRLKKQAQANNEETTFMTKVENGDLKIYFGDQSNHSGNFVFHPDCGGALGKAWSWPVRQFLSILDLNGDKTIKITDQGAAQITVDSGLAVYNYLLPAQAKS